MAGFTVIMILLIGLLLGVAIGFLLLWLSWLLLCWTAWKNALLPDEPVDIPAAPESRPS